jgi:hypothetical protein
MYTSEFWYTKEEAMQLAKEHTEEYGVTFSILEKDDSYAFTYSLDENIISIATQFNNL